MPNETGNQIIESIRSQLGLEPPEPDGPDQGWEAWIDQYEPGMAGSGGNISEEVSLSGIRKSYNQAMKAMDGIRELLNYGGTDTNEREMQAVMVSMKAAAANAEKALAHLKRKG